MRLSVGSPGKRPINAMTISASRMASAVLYGSRCRAAGPAGQARIVVWRPAESRAAAVVRSRLRGGGGGLDQGFGDRHRDACCVVAVGEHGDGDAFAGEMGERAAEPVG